MQWNSSLLAWHSLRRNCETDSTFHDHLLFHYRLANDLGSRYDSDLISKNKDYYKAEEQLYNPDVSCLKNKFDKWSREEAEMSVVRLILSVNGLKNTCRLC